MAGRIMIQGTMSGAGKSLLTAALCRIFHQDGLRAAPFKSQNMSLNSCVTDDGLEMGRAQALQAQAAGLRPNVDMNPILLKPSGDNMSQLIVGGRARGHFRARDYFKMKKSLIPDILQAYRRLEAENDVIVIEGAGSPAEINLREDDIVNMGLAELVDAPVLLAGDIDRGGVFAQLYGTVSLLREGERRRIKGLLVNKFRGDKTILDPGLDMLENLTGIPVLGVIPYLNVDLDEEDSVSDRFTQAAANKPVDIAVIRLPRISNETDFAPLQEHPAVGVRYVRRYHELKDPDMIILPGTKNTIEDLIWLRENGLEMAVRRKAMAGTVLLGICGGFQMLGENISDPSGAERGGEIRGMQLLDCTTVFSDDKTLSNSHALLLPSPFDGLRVQGYEIHMGQTVRRSGAPFSRLDDGREDGAVCGSVYGTYLHGLFDNGALVDALAKWLLGRKGIRADKIMLRDHQDYQEEQLDLLAREVRRSVDMDRIRKIIWEGSHGD